MVTQQKTTGRASSLPAGLAAGAAVSMGTTIVICCLGAWLISSEILEQELIGYCSVVALLLAAPLGGLTAMNRIKRKRLTVSLINGVVYFGILIAVTISFFDGNFQGMGVTLVVIMIGSLIAAMPVNRGNKHKTGTKFRKIHR